MAVYIKASSMVSAQKTFGEKVLSDAPVKAENACLKIIAPNYDEHVALSKLRRMSRIVKFSLASAFNCLGQVEDISIDAIITATGLGCVEDTGVFLTQMHQNGEKLLNPTAFIRSTHNAVGGQIALLLKLHVPNLCHTQKEVSFETGLIDGLMMLEDGDAKNVLVGAFDEITDLRIDLWKQMGCLSETIVDKNILLTAKNKGIVLGEGAGFFVLSTEQGTSGYSKLVDVELHRSASEDLASLANKFLTKHNLNNTNIDLLILGLDGSPNTKDLVKLMNTSFETSTVAGFKHLSGCFDTDSAFALWLANSAIVNENISIESCLRGENKREFENVLIVNSSKANSYSFSLLAKC